MLICIGSGPMCSVPRLLLLRSTSLNKRGVFATKLSIFKTPGHGSDARRLYSYLISTSELPKAMTPALDYTPNPKRFVLGAE